MKKENNLLDKLDFTFRALESCPFCECPVMIPNGSIRWLETDFWYVICPECGLKFMNPQPTRDSYQKFYKDQFWQQKIRNKGFHQPGQAWNKEKYSFDNEEEWDPEDGRRNRIEKHRTQRPQTIIPILQEEISITKDTSILEVGCGYGVTLSLLNKNFGCTVHAIEPSTDAREVIEKDKNIALVGEYAEDLERIAQSSNKYDAIIFSHVLENICEPYVVTNWAKNSLAEGGLIYVQTPNLLVYNQMNPYHPYIFSDSSLRMLAKKLGLEYVRIPDLIGRMLIVIMR